MKTVKLAADLSALHADFLTLAEGRTMTKDELVYGPLCEEVKQELVKHGLPTEGYTLDTLGENIAAVNRAVADKRLDAPVTRRAWIAAIVAQVKASRLH